jgi:phenylacetate-CoA ligase
MNVADQFQIAAGLVAAIRSQWWSAEKIRKHQEASLVRIMRHAAAQVPFYRRLGLPADAIGGAADLRRFPVIGKRDVQRQPEAFIADGLATQDLHASRTSGSSGRPTTTYFDRTAWLLGKYILKMRRVAATCGLPLLRRVMIVSEQSPERLAAEVRDGPSGLGVFFRRRYLSIHSPIRDHLTELARYRPHMIYAFPSYLIDLVTAAERCNVELPKVDVLYTSSEVLTVAARIRIETAFAGRVYDVYGSTEFKEVAWQCHAGRHHLNFENIYIEPQDPGSCGPVILTSLCNFAMPLLRFDIGDRAVFGFNVCPCGRRSPHLVEIAGREGDMITLPSGRRLSPYLLTTAIESEDSILQYQIIQTEPDAFRIDAVVRSPGQSARWQGPLCAELLRRAAEPVGFMVREVDHLVRAPSGKRSIIVRRTPVPADPVL